ncbi:hypothetical protein CEP53_014271 [Fusarium sp. AF-6]|nr:hypothetical protein CEP53_014271 [Fusarium sp. AF-6]
MATMKEQYDLAMETLIRPVQYTSDDLKRYIDLHLKQWASSFRQINASSWIIFNKAILTQLPLSKTDEEPNDYVDRNEGFIYRIRELGDDEARPAKTTRIPDKGPVRPNYRAWEPLYVEYNVGSTGCLKFVPAKADATHVNHHALEHENIEYVSKQGPKHFRVPRVVYHIEFEGKYSILTERVGTPVLDRPIPFRFLTRLLSQIAEAVAEMARWEAPSIQSVNGKDVQWWIFEHVILDIFAEGKRASNYLQEYLGGKGFTLSPCGFLNGHTGLRDVGLDEDFNLVGFNNWGQCAFVPKGYIMPFVLYNMDAFGPPVDPKVLPALTQALWRTGMASMTCKMIKGGLSDETESFSTLLSEQIAIRARHQEREKLGLPWRRGWLFPDNDPDYRPEIYDAE